MPNPGAPLVLALALVARMATAQEPIDARWSFESGGSVRVASAVGRIQVIGWDVDSLAVSGRLEPGAGRFVAAGDARVRKLEIERPAGARAAAGGAELVVRVPRRATVWVKSASADITVTGVDGTLDVYSVSGGIQVTGTPQDVTVETMDGRVEVAGGTGRAQVKTVSGDILLRGASTDLGASTLSGTIVVRAAGWQRGGTGVQRGRFESVTGDIQFVGDVGRGGVLELESQSGKVDVRLAPTTVADFDLLTIGGTITNTLTPATPQRPATGGGAALKFSTGSGGAQLTVRTFRGPIVLEPKP
jgi:hypothetical protein